MSRYIEPPSEYDEFLAKLYRDIFKLILKQRQSLQIEVLIHRLEVILSKGELIVLKSIIATADGATRKKMDLDEGVTDMLVVPSQFSFEDVFEGE